MNIYTETLTTDVRVTESDNDTTPLTHTVNDLNFNMNITASDNAYNLSRVLRELDGQIVDEAFSEV